MSRFTHITSDRKHLVAHGYDKQMLEYFIQVHDKEAIDEDNTIIVWEGSRMTGKSNGEMMELFTKWGIEERFPKNFDKLTLDLPF